MFVGLPGLELVALLLGRSLMAGAGELDMDVDVAPDVAPDVSTPGPTSWLELGRVPFMI